MGALAGLGAAASAADQPEAKPAATVNAEGNFTGGLAFDPVAVTVKVGDVVEWVNTDSLVPHTATEDHGLWELTGTYGGTPANPPGFGPGEKRRRAFAAGGWSYYCAVHPEEMKAKVNVPVTLATETIVRPNRPKKGKKARKLKLHRVLATWASEPLPEGQAFEVQRQSGGGAWTTVRGATRDLKGAFRGGKRGTEWGFRVRVFRVSKPADASDYSPAASVKIP